MELTLDEFYIYELLGKALDYAKASSIARERVEDIFTFVLARERHEEADHV
jgi:hypothetical protein